MWTFNEADTVWNQGTNTLVVVPMYLVEGEEATETAYYDPTVVDVFINNTAATVIWDGLPITPTSIFVNGGNRLEIDIPVDTLVGTGLMEISLPADVFSYLGVQSGGGAVLSRVFP
jgi:hypothetical protein